MLKAHLVVTFLRLLLVSAFAFLVLFQIAILPGTIWHQAREEPDMAHLRWPSWWCPTWSSSACRS